MVISNPVRKYIVIGVLFAVIVGLVVATIVGGKQDDIYITDDAIYTVFTQQIQDSKYKDALNTVELFEGSKNSSELVNYLIAIAAVNEGELDRATLHFQRTLDINPYKVENQLFMLQYAEVLVQANKTNEAQEVLERCKTLPIPQTYPDYKERIQQLQDYITGTQM